MSLHAGDVDRAWKKLGMDIADSNDRHARLYVNGRLVIWTRRSLGSGPIEGEIPYFIGQQMRLDAEQFKGVIDCPIGRSEYIEILRQKGLIPAQ